MYRVSPATYFVSSITAAGLGGENVPIECSPKELVVLDPSPGQTCGQYLAGYLQYSPARLLNADAMVACQLCPASNTAQVLAAIGIIFDDRWRDLGISVVYTVFNILAALLLYWAFRTPKKSAGVK